MWFRGFWQRLIGKSKPKRTSGQMVFGDTTELIRHLKPQTGLQGGIAAGESNPGGTYHDLRGIASWSDILEIVLFHYGDEKDDYEITIGDWVSMSGKSRGFFRSYLTLTVGQLKQYRQSEQEFKRDDT